jgi:hypothetical protein
LIQKCGLEGVVSRVGHCDDMPAALMTASVLASGGLQRRYAVLSCYARQLARGHGIVRVGPVLQSK